MLDVRRRVVLATSFYEFEGCLCRHRLPMLPKCPC
jgi:hypothetical protein